jgi:stearoyl-CoA desaturase (Delta-9 desaturase)
MAGYRSFDTPERSCNNILLGLPTLGEAWHNNHHAFPRSAFFGVAWWEVDIGGLVIRLLDWLGLAWNVRWPGATVPVDRQAFAGTVDPGVSEEADAT